MSASSLRHPWYFWLIMKGLRFSIFQNHNLSLIISPILQTFFEEFESPCNHGFFNRGDLDDPAVAECVNRGLENLVSFLIEYVVNN